MGAAIILGALGWAAGWAAGKVTNAPDAAALVCSIAFAAVGTGLTVVLPEVPLTVSWLPWAAGAWLLLLAAAAAGTFLYIRRSRLGFGLRGTVMEPPPAAIEVPRVIVVTPEQARAGRLHA
jgi:hypothetical protein